MFPKKSASTAMVVEFSNLLYKYCLHSSVSWFVLFCSILFYSVIKFYFLSFFFTFFFIHSQLFIYFLIFNFLLLLFFDGLRTPHSAFSEQPNKYRNKKNNRTDTARQRVWKQNKTE